jgi:hypothetical protein
MFGTSSDESPVSANPLYQKESDNISMGPRPEAQVHKPPMILLSPLITMNSLCCDQKNLAMEFHVSSLLATENKPSLWYGLALRLWLRLQKTPRRRYGVGSAPLEDRNRKDLR